jgi:hypothetical protein
MSSVYSGPQNHLASTANGTDDTYRDTGGRNGGIRRCCSATSAA